MTLADRLVLKRQRHLKWRVLDPLETVLMLLCGALLFGFCMTVICDIITREIGRPWLWLQEVTSTFFIYAIFVGTAVATRRNDHLYLTAIAESLHGTSRTIIEITTRMVVLVVGLCFIYFGYLNFLRGFGSFRMPSMTPIASLYAAIPICGVLIVLFTIEQLVNGLRNGFEHDEPPEEPMHITPIDTVAPIDVVPGPGGRP
jgi:TRAP-type C4-dicarboxylate transport system permease small subunit